MWVRSLSACHPCGPRHNHAVRAWPRRSAERPMRYDSGRDRTLAMSSAGVRLWPVSARTHCGGQSPIAMHVASHSGRAWHLLRPAARVGVSKPDLIPPNIRRSRLPDGLALHLRPETSCAVQRTVFNQTCASCDIGGSGTNNNNGTLHSPADTGVDGAYAARTANKAYRTTPQRCAVATRAVLPRRQCRHARGRGCALQPGAEPRSYHCAAARPG